MVLNITTSTIDAFEEANGIMIVLFEILILFCFKQIRSSWAALNEIMIALIAKGTQGLLVSMKQCPCQR